MSQKDLNNSLSNFQSENIRNNNQLGDQNVPLNIQHHPSFISVNYEPSSKNQSDKQDNNQQLQRVSVHQNVINQDQILKMFAEQAEKQEKQKKQLELKKRMSKQKKLKQKQKQKSLLFQHQGSNSQKQIKNADHPEIQVLKKIDIRSKPLLQNLLTQYKIQYHFSFFDNELTKYRYQCKFSLFLQLVVGVFYLKNLPKEQLSIQEQQLLKSLQAENRKYKNSKFNIAIFKHCRKVTYEVDHNLFSYYQKKNFIISKQYKLQWSYLLNNIKDPQNFQLRRKIVSNAFTPEQIIRAQEIQFFTTQKKNQVKQKQAKFLAQFTAEDKNFPQQQNQEIIERGRFESFDFKAQMRQKKVVSSKYVDQTTLNLLQELVSREHLNKMKNRIQEDLREPILSKIINNFMKEFKKQI